MLVLLDVTLRQRVPNRRTDAFQLLAGDLALLEKMLPRSNFVSSLELGHGSETSIRTITEFREELISLDESSLPEGEFARATFHPEFGTVNAIDLRQDLIRSIDRSLLRLFGVVPL